MSHSFRRFDRDDIDDAPLTKLNKRQTRLLASLYEDDFDTLADIPSKTIQHEKALVDEFLTPHN